MKIASATQTSAKPIQRPLDMSSWKYRTPSPNCRTGARYCSSPRVTIGTRMAAAPKTEQRHGRDESRRT